MIEPPAATPWRSRAIAVLLLALCTSSFVVIPASSSAADTESPLGTAERVLVFSVPTLGWEDLEGQDAPNLERFLSDAAVAALSVRSVTRSTNATDAYATFNAGTRAEGTPLSQLAFVAGRSRAGGLDENGDPLEVPTEAYSEEVPGEVPEALIEAPVTVPSEPSQPEGAPQTYVGTPVAEEFARRTGVSPKLGQVFNFGVVSLEKVNRRLLFGAEVGALGDALEAAGVARAVVANGDHGEGSDFVDFRREASVALMDGDGLVESGKVSRDLLAEEAAAPFGLRYDNTEVASAFGELWASSRVVLVEASDMVRAEDAEALSTDKQAERLRSQAITWSDELFGSLMAEVDPGRDAVVVVAPYALDAGTSLTVLGIAAPGVESGLLSSGTTRRAGHVQSVDLAPTVLSLVGVSPPGSMEGTTVRTTGEAGDWAERVDRFVSVDEAAAFRDGIVGFAAAAFVVAQVVLWILALLALARGSTSMGGALEIATLAVLLWLPATFVTGALPFHRWPAVLFWVCTVALGLAGATAIWFATRRALVDPLLSTLSVVVLFLSADLLVGAPLQFNTVFGYTPTVAGRFDGMGNPAFAMFAASALILSALVAHRVGGRRGIWAAAAILVWAIVMDASPFLGADVGGALAMVPAAAVTVWMLLGLRVRLRSAMAWGGAAVVAVVVLGLVDMARPSAERTHLGRLMADVGENGFEAFQTVVLRKLDANLSVLLSSVWTLMLPLVFASVMVVFWRSPWRLQTIRRRVPEERAAVAGLLTAMVLGFALNDSGIAVPGMMLGVASASLIHLMFRVEPAEHDSPVGGTEPSGRSGPAEDQPDGVQASRT